MADVPDPRRSPPRATTWTGTTGDGSSNDQPQLARSSHETPRATTSTDAARSSLQSLPSRVTATARDRGYSLRRSLFAQNIQRQNPQHASVMEMEFSVPSAQSDPENGVEKEKHGPAVITIQDSPVYGPNDRQLGSFGKKGPSQAHGAVRPSKNIPILSNILLLLDALRVRIVGPSELPPTADGRHVQVNVNHNFDPVDERTGKPYIGNRIRSCKYTIWNFLPLQLVAQFGKLANFYFLIISILQLIPGLSTTGTFTTIVPLMIFVSISMAKEGYEDIRRNRLDKEENECAISILDNTFAWAKKKWQDVRIGDIVLLERDRACPADIILLHASNADNIAYIETKSLDGETNLKSKKPLDLISQRCTTDAAAGQLEADFVVEDPNLDLYKFDGRVSCAGEMMPLTLNEVVYRGSILRNTPKALGIVIYSGEECKIRMNANKNPRVKAPALQAKVNRVVILVACLVFFIAIILSIGYVIWKRTTENGSWYLDDADVPYGHVLVSFIIMLNTMLPLSLYVSLEIVKVCQMLLLGQDVDMYDPVSDRPIEPRTSSLNEELGQVSYIFSDKTGTLTNNSMKFRKLSIAGTAWLHDHDMIDEHDATGSRLRHKKRSTKGKEKQSKKYHHRGDSKSPLVVQTSTPPQASPRVEEAPHPPFSRTGRTDDLLYYLTHRPQSLFAKKVRFFILALALCHTCLPEKDEDGEITYQAASPDELALVTAAQDLGFIVTDRQTNTITVKTFDNDLDNPRFETFQVLDVIEFTSSRKRMSIIVRLPDGRICIFCKGADTTIRTLLRQAELAATYVEDIRRKSEARKSYEVRAAFQRRSSQLHRDSVGSPLAGARQSGVSVGRRQSRKESVDLWLREKESAGRVSEKNTTHYTPRNSDTILAQDRLSRTSADSPRSSIQEAGLDALVDEAVVIDDHAVFERCFNHIDDFAREGLRTLVYAHRFVPEEEYQQWREIHHAAATSLKDRQEKLEKAAEIIEQQLELTGATAIEDKLQAGVPDAIERLRRAGIKMWMLTGDKRETAINIGHSCRLIKDYSHTMVLDYLAGDLVKQISNFIAEIAGGTHAHTVLVIDGQTLTTIDTDLAIKSLFTELAVATDSVVCCRASPSQKADLVRTIRTKVSGSVTLAIGDGANDVAMIQEAHLGIGIAGKEGLQAARCSDYSIAQFRFLLKLLLVHGRWNYVRVCKYTLGTFWKEMIFYLTQATFQRWNGYTGTSLFEPWSLSMFNTLFTSLPVIFLGIFEKDLNPATLLAAPELYEHGRLNRGFSIKLYAWWAFIGAVESQIVYWTIYGIFGQALFTRDNHIFSMGALTYTACVTLISLKLLFFELQYKSAPIAVAAFLSIGGWYLWNLILSQTYDPYDEIYYVRNGITKGFGRNPLWWLTLIVTVLEVSLFETIIKTFKVSYLPNDVETFQILERDLEVKKRFEEAAADLLQQGWDRGTKKSSVEVQREAAEQAKREAEVQDMLDRPRTMDGHSRPDRNGEEGPVVVGIAKRQSWQPAELEMVPPVQQQQQQQQRDADSGGVATTRKSIDVGELFAKGYGMVRKGSMK